MSSPLKSRKSTWLVNRKLEIKVIRKGYHLIPDNACTAHMVQGMTLEALLADCGDVLDHPALKDMLAGYVSLSRVRKAETLLLLRAFSRYLFQQGPPPGPRCLMKRLRSRCGAEGASVNAEEMDAAMALRLAAETPSASVCSTEASGRHTTEKQTT